MQSIGNRVIDPNFMNTSTSLDMIQPYEQINIITMQDMQRTLHESTGIRLEQPAT